MQAEFYRPDAPEEIVARARWDGARVEVEAEDPKVRRALERVFRPSAVVVDDPALRSFGAHGPEALPPGSLPWFIGAARMRSAPEKLAVRLVPQARGRMGWDPAGAYRTFGAAIDRLERRGSAPVAPEPAV